MRNQPIGLFRQRLFTLMSEKSKELIAVAPLVGTARIVSAASSIVQALGITDDTLKESKNRGSD